MVVYGEARKPLKSLTATPILASPTSRAIYRVIPSYRFQQKNCSPEGKSLSIQSYRRSRQFVYHLCRKGVFLRGFQATQGYGTHNCSHTPIGQRRHRPTPLQATPQTMQACMVWGAASVASFLSNISRKVNGDALCPEGEPGPEAGGDVDLHRLDARQPGLTVGKLSAYHVNPPAVDQVLHLLHRNGLRDGRAGREAERRGIGGTRFAGRGAILRLQAYRLPRDRLVALRRFRHPDRQLVILRQRLRLQIARVDELHRERERDDLFESAIGGGLLPGGGCGLHRLTGSKLAFLNLFSQHIAPRLLLR